MASLLITILLGSLVPNVGWAQSIDQGELTITMDMDFAYATHIRGFVNDACDGLNMAVPKAACDNQAATKFKSSSAFEIRQSRLRLSASNKSEGGEAGVKLDIYPDESPYTLGRLYGYALLNRFGFFSFGWQDPAVDSLSVNASFTSERDLSQHVGIRDETHAGRLYGMGFAPRNINMVAYDKSVARVSYRSLYLYDMFRWGWTYGVDNTTDSWSVDHLRHHLSAEFRFHYYRSEDEFGFEIGGGSATRVYRRGAGLHNQPIPISGTLGIRVYLKSFRIALAGTYNGFAVNAGHGSGECGLHMDDSTVRCGESWAVQSTFGYYDPDYQVFLTFLYGAAPGVARRDKLSQARADKVGLANTSYGTDGYTRLELHYNARIKPDFEGYAKAYYAYENVATSPAGVYKPNSPSYRHATLSDGHAFGLIVGTRLQF